MTELDRLSGDLARSILDPLDDGQVTVSVEDPHSADAQHCLRRYFAEIDERFESGFDPTLTVPVEEMAPPLGLFLVARLREAPVGCGGLRHRPNAPPELKRMWVDPAARGLGLGRRLLRELESHALAVGARAVRLETNDVLVEALRLYRSSGYEEVPAFNDERYAHHWFEKRLTPPEG